MLLPIIKLVAICFALILSFFQAKNRNAILIIFLVVILFLEGLSQFLDYKKNAPEFAFISQKIYFDDYNPTSAKFKFEFRNLGGRTAKNISVDIKLFCDDELVEEDSFRPRDKLPNQSMFPLMTFPRKACDEVFQKNKTMKAKFEINHKEGPQIIWLKFQRSPDRLEESKWREFDFE